MHRPAVDSSISSGIHPISTLPLADRPAAGGGSRAAFTAARRVDDDDDDDIISVPYEGYDEAPFDDPFKAI